MREEMNEILAQHSSQTLEKIRRDTERDFWMTSQAAKEYGLIDDILERRELAPAAALAG